MPLRKKPLPRKRIFRKNIKEERSELNPAKFKDHVEVIGKTVLGIVAFCYAVGILVESLYLGSFGVYQVNLFRFAYIFAGLWALVIFILPMVPIITMMYILWHWLILSDKPTRRSYWLSTFYIVATIVAVEYATFKPLGIMINGDFFWGIAYSVFSMFAIIGLYRLLHHRKTVYKKALKITFVILIVLSIGSFLNFLGFFSKNTFPQIPARFGGGKPLTVQLLIEANKQNAWMIQKNFDLCENDKAKIAVPDEVQLIATKPMPLLLATDTDYIIRKDENTAVSISRDQVKTVLYLDNVDPNKDVCAAPEPQ